MTDPTPATVVRPVALALRCGHQVIAWENRAAPTFDTDTSLRCPPCRTTRTVETVEPVLTFPTSTPDGYRPPPRQVMRLAFALAADLGLRSRDDRLDLASKILARTIRSWTHLTWAETTRMIDAMIAFRDIGFLLATAPPPAPVTNSGSPALLVAASRLTGRTVNALSELTDDEIVTVLHLTAELAAATPVVARHHSIVATHG